MFLVILLLASPIVAFCSPMPDAASNIFRNGPDFLATEAPSHSDQLVKRSPGHDGLFNNYPEDPVSEKKKPKKVKKRSPGHTIQRTTIQRTRGKRNQTK